MAIKPVNLFTDPDGLKILKTPCLQIAQALPQYDELVTNLIDTASSLPGCVGLSANQIWDYPDIPAPAIFIVPGAVKGTWATCVNPQVEKSWKKVTKAFEGCMSIPGYKREIERPRHICVSFFDGDKQFQSGIHMFDMAARIFLHEMDHINGKLINE